MSNARKLFRPAALALAAGLLLWGCAKDETARGEGEVSLGVGFDSRTVAEMSVTKADGAAVPEYVTVIRDAQGRKIRQYDTPSDLPGQVWLQTGNYTVEVTAGEDVTAAFDKPYYTGSSVITVEPDRVTDGSVVCTLANAKVSVVYKEGIRTHFRKFETKIGPDAGNLLTFDGTEGQTGFYKTGEGAGAVTLGWKLEVENTAGQTYSREGSFTAEPCSHYTVEFDIPEGEEFVEGGMIFDRITVEEDAVSKSGSVNIPMKKLPELYMEGHDIATDFIIMRGSGSVTPRTRVAVKGWPEIAGITLTHDCQYLHDHDIPVSVNLFSLKQAAKEIVRRTGIDWAEKAEGATDPFNQSYVDFTELMEKLPVGSYRFGLTAGDNRGKTRSATLSVVIIESDVLTVSPDNPMADFWARSAMLRGQWVTASRPSALGFEYKKTSESAWTRVTEGFTYNDAAKSYTLKLKNLDPESDYEYRAIAGEVPGNTQAFRTERVQEIPDLRFDDWYTSSKGAIYPCTPAQWSANSYWFDSGNGGTNTMSVNTTQGETDPSYVKGGSAAARMRSQYVGVGGALGKFAAGNIFTGRFVERDGFGAKLQFGRPYAARPTALKGWIKYTPVKVTHTDTPEITKDDMDRCHIYVALCAWDKPHDTNTNNSSSFPDWSTNNKSVIAYGEYTQTEGTEIPEYIEITIPIEYRDLTRTPTYIVIAGSASKYGDYFSGGEGSILWMDEFELVFE